jgi:hypothetical protein
MYQPSTDFSALFNVHGRDLKGSARLFRANIIKKGSNDLSTVSAPTRSPSTPRTTSNCPATAPTCTCAGTAAG